MTASGLFLLPKPHPVPHPRITNGERAAVLRRLYCAQYQGCLDQAVAENWEGFACVACQVREVISCERVHQDLDAMGDAYQRANEEYGRQVVRERRERTSVGVKWKP